MDDTKAKRIRSELDRELLLFSTKVGIFFGQELFNEFRDRKWITLETFGAEGTFVLKENVPAYDKTHLAILDWGISDLEFRVGKINP